MKKLKFILACVLLCIATAFADVQINETNFPCENFRNWFLEQWFASDSVITDTNVRNVRRISIANRNISDLTGIKFFTNLEHLWCINN